MSFQDSSQQPFPPQQPGWGGPGPQPQQGQQQPQQAWGQQGQQPPQPQPGWGPQGQQGQPGPQGQQQPAAQSSWGAPDQAPAPDGSSQGWGWGSQQPQTPPQAGYGYGAAPGQGPGQPQDHAAQGFPQQPPQAQIPQPQGGHPGGGFASGSGGYYPQQSDFGSGIGYGPGYPAPGSQQNSGLATVALWLGILGGWGLINLVVSILAIKDTGRGRKAGRGKALAGLYLTLVWCVIWIGVFVAVSGHVSTVGTADPPKNPFAGAAGGTPAGTVYLTGATDPGCLTVQKAFDEMVASKASPTSVTAYIAALQAGSGQSRIAGDQISTVALEWSKIGTTSQTQMFDDMQALQTACAMTLTPTDPR